MFAVLDDGKTLEPVGVVENGKLVEAANGGGEPKDLAAFARTYYKPNAVYDLIFGATQSGIVTIKNSQTETECAKNQAVVAVKSATAKLKGFVMGLATNINPAGQHILASRRLPTAAERAKIEALVRAEFAKQKVSAAAIKNLKYYNLTALGAGGDGEPKMVGSYWTETPGKERNELFFIAEKDGAGKFKFGYSDYKKVTPKDLMSGDLKDLDERGIELLLDALDYDKDGTAEIFTVNKSFEGDNFYVYSRQSGKWTRVFETYNYHCAY